MIYVKEKLINEGTIDVCADGMWDSIPVTKDVRTHRLENHKNITIYLRGLLHVTREGKDFFTEIQNRARILLELFLSAIGLNI